MKKLIFSLVLLLGVVGSMSAQQQKKSYIHLIGWSMNAGAKAYYELSGDLPEGVNKSYTKSEMSFGDLLTLLGENGFVVTSLSTTCNSSGYDSEFVILSKDTTTDSGTATNAKSITKVESGDEVTEVARYNLQGIPVKSTDKGVQIIVYSNYTTKTVVVE